MQPPIYQNKYTELDGMRAILALMVTICHSVIWLSITGNKVLFTYPILSTLKSSSEFIVRGILFFAVGVGTIYSFFIFSGFILAHTLNSILKKNVASKRQSLIVMYQYLFIQRISRIMPLHILFVTLTSLALYVMHRTNNNLASNFYYIFYDHAPTFIEYIKNILFLSATMNPVSWTLFHEIWPFIIVMPMFVLFSQNNLIITDCLIIIGLFILGQAMQQLIQFPWGMNPFAYLFLFYAGVMFYNKRHSINTINIGHPMIYLFLMPTSRLFAENLIFINSWEGLTSILFIASIFSLKSHSKTLVVLRNKTLQSLGVRTYGFYLAHFPILYIIATLIFLHTPQALLINNPIMILFFTMITSIGLAVLFSYKISYPIELFWTNIRKRKNNDESLALVIP